MNPAGRCDLSQQCTAIPFANRRADRHTRDGPERLWPNRVRPVHSSRMVPRTCLLSTEDRALPTIIPPRSDRNPVAQNDSAVSAINKSIKSAVLANDTAAAGQSLEPCSDLGALSNEPTGVSVVGQLNQRGPIARIRTPRPGVGTVGLAFGPDPPRYGARL